MINKLKLIWNKIWPTKLVYRPMGIHDVDFVLKSLYSGAKEGHFSAAILDHIEYMNLYTAFMCRAHNQIVSKQLEDGKIVQLTNFVFIFENGNKEKLGFIELSEKHPGDFCRNTLEFENVEILTLVVSEEYRGKGYAEKFISMALNEFSVRKTIFARCLKPSTHMVKILEKLGFSCINTTPKGSKWMELKVS
ncbi:GNAT family N-acetyltransferase [Vibrio parahaemolyticus]|uniref:GNAT family N-acetyltransferase n=1 Tax=Vibrio parahaemolyticus TaxID=670 RepID=UPI001E3A7EA7|nr:GNAT family N-acetyltransferase [Vibrio parahaemolyticus]MCD1416953.1 GNAT family N-acetyltransferase [Vibrio parahaemolyticus]